MRRSIPLGRCHHDYSDLVCSALVFGLLLKSAFAQLSSLGLPRVNHCALAYNHTLHVFGGDDPNNATAASPPYLTLTFADSIAIRGPNITQHNVSTAMLVDIIHGGCAVTSYGQAILLPPDAAAYAFDLVTFQSTAIPGRGAPLATQSFSAAANRTVALPRRDVAMAMWGDTLVVFGGTVRMGDAARVAANTTFFLDCRIPSYWTWTEIPVSTLTPPATFSRTAMVATKRWILHFSHANASSVAVYCFDPLVMAWRGQVLAFDPAVPFVAPVAVHVNGSASDTVVLFPAQDSTDPLPPPHRLWLLTMSSQQPEGTVVPIPVTDNPFYPVSGTVTAIDNLVVLYGGMGAANNSLRFWDATTMSFVVPSWLQRITATSTATASPTSTTPVPSHDAQENNANERHIAIIVGTIFGVFGLVLVAIFIWLVCRRRRRERERSMRSNAPTPMPYVTRHVLTVPSNDASALLQTSPIDTDASSWAHQLLRSLSAITNRMSTDNSKGEPARGASIRLFNDPSSPRSQLTKAERERQRAVQEHSRFTERFDADLPEQVLLSDGVPMMVSESKPRL